MDRKNTLRQKEYVLVYFVMMAAAQLVCYYVPRIFLANRALVDIGSALDAKIPFLPGWVIVYILAYLSWAIGGVVILWNRRDYAPRFAFAYITAMLICGFCFAAFPATIQRPELAGEGFIMGLMRFIYSADTPTCLCPSLHVLISYMCWRGTLGCERIPKWYKWTFFVLFVLVSFSVVFVKQHAAADIPAGILAAEIAVRFADFIKPDALFKKHFI